MNLGSPFYSSSNRNIMCEEHCFIKSEQNRLRIGVLLFNPIFESVKLFHRFYVTTGRYLASLKYTVMCLIIMVRGIVHYE